MIKLLFCVLSLSERNSRPMTGTLPKPGTFCWRVVVLSRIKPPKAMVCWSSADGGINQAFIGNKATGIGGTARYSDETSCETSRRTVPLSPIWGITFRLIPISWRSMVWNGLVDESLPMVWAGDKKARFDQPKYWPFHYPRLKLMASTADWRWSTNQALVRLHHKTEYYLGCLFYYHRYRLTPQQ